MLLSPSRLRKPALGSRINPGHPLAAGLLAAYIFNEGAGNTLLDFSPYDERPTATGLAWGSDAGAAFDGTSSFVDLGNAARFDLVGPITLEAIFVLTTSANSVYPRLISKLSAFPFNGYELNIGAPDDGVRPSRIYLQGGNAGTLSACTGPVLSTNVEYSVVASFDGVSTTSLYVNGVPSVASNVGFSSSSAIASSSANVNLGRWPGASSNYFPGRIRKLAIYNRVLDAGAVAWLYADPYAFARSISFLPPLPPTAGVNTIPCTLASLASSATAARESDAIDNSVSRRTDALVQLKVKTGAGTPGNDKAIWIYAWGNCGDAIYPTGVTGADAAITLLNPSDLKVIGKLEAPLANTTYISEAFSVGAAFGGLLPVKWGIVIRNYTGEALSPNNGDHLLQYVGAAY